jgi:hypothetical protein
MLRADVYIQEGELAKIVFDKPPIQNWMQLDRTPDEIDILAVELILDPTDEHALEILPRTGTTQLVGWLGRMNERSLIGNCGTPLPEILRSKLIRFYDVELPNDYLELTHQAEGCTVGSCTVLGLSQMISAVTPTESYYIVAWIENTGLLAFLRGAPPGVYYVDNEEHIPVKVSESLGDAIDKIIEYGPDVWRTN